MYAYSKVLLSLDMTYTTVERSGFAVGGVDGHVIFTAVFHAWHAINKRFFIQ
jgi:hypothetical protein